MEKGSNKVMKKHVFYFSPTGGTKMTAVYIAKELEGAEIDITERCQEMEISEEDLAVFCFPVYCGRVPIPVYERMAHIKGNNTPAVVVACYGSRDVGDAMIEMGDKLKQKGFKVVGGAEVITPHAFNPEVGKFRPDEDDRELIFDFLHKLLAKPVMNEVQMPGDPEYMNKKRVKLPMYPKPDRKECIGCGMCFKYCPMHAISEVKMKTNKKKCISCLRCIDMCSTTSRHLPKVDQVIGEVSVVAMAGIRKKKPKFYM